MKEKALELLKEEFGDEEFLYEFLDCKANSCAVLTISNVFERKNRKSVTLYHVFKIENEFKLSYAYEFSFCGAEKIVPSDLLEGIANVAKVYGELCK